jgi:Major Facilitator Superfamily
VTTETAESTQVLPADQSTGVPRRWLALPVLLTGAFLPILDFNVVNLALPAIRADLAASSSEVQFVISAYAATYAVFLITGGRLGDLYGRRQMFLLGVAGFTIASVLCGVAWSPAVLVSGRILQGLTATAMAPQVLASIRVLFPPDEQGRALALYGATFGLANICGQAACSSPRIPWDWPGRRSSSSTCRSALPPSSAGCFSCPTRVRESRSGSISAASYCGRSPSPSWSIRWSKGGKPDGRHGLSPC